MSKVSDIIEEFILEQLEDTEYVNLSRNELANFFGCAPSQINYVLSTRFTEPKGFLIESHRGGGGYIKLSKFDFKKDDYIKELISNTLLNPIDYQECDSILNNLYALKILSRDAVLTLKYALSPKSLSLPVKIEDRLRANILKNVLINILRGN